MVGALYESAPKTKSSDRVVILPQAVLPVLQELKERTNSRWMFPSLVKEGATLNPQSVYQKMKIVLVRAQCKDIRAIYLSYHNEKYKSLTFILLRN